MARKSALRIPRPLDYNFSLRGLRDSVRELGKRLSYLTHGGRCNPTIAAELERARRALRSCPRISK